MEYTQGSGVNPVITVKRTVNDSMAWPNYTYSTIDGGRIPDEGHKADKGSLVLTLMGKYLDTLSPGSHTVQVSFTDGSADVTLNIKSKPVPKTGDKANPLLWLAMILLGLAGICANAAKRQKKQR